MYIISNILYFIIRYILRYRYKVVYTNLKNAYTEKEEKEIGKILNGFYRNLCDSTLEAYSTLLMSREKMKEHFVCTNPEMLQYLADSGKNTVALFGHYANWEWVSSVPLWNDNFNISTLYKPLKNKFFDNLYLNIRQRFGTVCIDKNQVLKGMSKMSRMGKPYAVAFIADQSPSSKNIHHWETFLNQDSAMLTGWETIARKTNNNVVYLDVTKKSRGHYECEIQMIEENPKELKQWDLTHKYVKCLEKTIERDPSLWLWSHKRWKHKRDAK